MPKIDNSILEQLRRNTVALISLVVAVGSLSYNTWRNELTEENRNLRFAGFEILLKLGELQQVTFHGHYDRDPDKGNPRTGWAYALTIRDLSQVLSPAVQQQADSLIEVWGANWEDLGGNQQSVDTIVAAIDAARSATLDQLASLD